MLSVGYLVCAVLAYRRAGAAANTFLRGEQEFLFVGLRFGIMTPLAAQRTTLEKNSSSDPGAVMHTKPLDFRYFHGLLFLSSVL